MRTKTDEIIEKIQSSYSRILLLYRGGTVDELLEPVLANGWSVKDTLAHIAAWESRCAALLAEGRDSNAPLKATPDVEALNQEVFEERQRWSWAEVESEFLGAHKDLLEAIQSLPPDRLNDALVWESIAEETWQHYEEHLPDLEQWHEQVIQRK